MKTSGRWPWRSATRKECVTTHLHNLLAPQMDGRHGSIRRKVRRCKHRESVRRSLTRALDEHRVGKELSVEITRERMKRSDGGRNWWTKTVQISRLLSINRAYWLRRILVRVSGAVSSADLGCSSDDSDGALRAIGPCSFEDRGGARFRRNRGGLRVSRS